jgi:hypothetical protein
VLYKSSPFIATCGAEEGIDITVKETEKILYFAQATVFVSVVIKCQSQV